MYLFTEGVVHFLWHALLDIASQILNPDGGATSTSSSTTNVVVVLALYYPLVKLLRAAPHSEVTSPSAGDDTWV